MIKVLIADDQELIRQSLSIVLNTKEGIEVTDTVANGQEVIASVRKNRPDVILMDISTINFMIARLLEEKPKRITIITQSLDLIVVLSSINEINIISLGGSFDKKNRAFLGRITSSNIKKINPLKCFLGAGGINIDRGNLRFSRF